MKPDQAINVAHNHSRGKKHARLVQWILLGVEQVAPLIICVLGL